MMIRALLATALALSIATPALAQAPESVPAEKQVNLVVAPDDPWPFAQSDLPVDEAYRFGVLENGMRYIIRPNATPAGQGKVQFWINFGSAAEAEHERGWAHFIEHMAFNGSTNVPEGEMVKLLEREGLAFGADTNAATGFDRTFYKLDLPRNDPGLLDTALMLMRETASELTFDEEAVQREKGVILSERRVRDTFQMRNLKANFDFLYPQSPLARRLPIGTIETIEAATGAGLKDLWSRYYRPRNTALIVVGDYDADEVEAAIRKHFASWEAAATVSDTDFGPIDSKLSGATDVFLDPALSEEITISRHGAYFDEPDTAARRERDVLKRIGYGIVNRRLQRLQRLGDPPFRAAGLSTSNVFEEARTTNLRVLAAEGEWERGLAAARDIYLQALKYGFSEAEVAEQVANFRTAVENNAKGAATRSHESFVGAAMALLSDDTIPTTPQSALERFNAYVDAITPEAVLAALREDLVPLDDPLIRFAGRQPPEGGEAALREAWDARPSEIARPVDLEAGLVDFGYSDFGPPGAITSDTVDERLGIRMLTFANGLKLNLKPTDLQEDRIALQLNVDGGDMLETREDPLATAMTSSLPVGGLGAHTLDELQTILAGRRVAFSVSSAPETFRFATGTTPRDLELQLQLLAAALTDPGFRPEGEAQYARNVTNWYASRTATPSSALATTIGAIISDNDPRHSLQEEEDYLALSFARLREAIMDRWDNGAMELALVGDFNADEAVALVAHTLGALPAREPEFRAYADNRDRTFTSDRSPRTVYHDGEADQAIVVMAWPTRDDSDHRASQVLQVLQRVMQLELTDTLREELGQTYSPRVDAAQSRIYPGYGTFDISAAIATSEVEATRDAMLATLAAIREAPVDADTLQRARQPVLEAYDNALKTNRGWMGLVDRAQTEPERIDRFLAGKEQLLSITAEEVQAAAALYLAPATRLEVTVLPRPEAGA